MQDIESIDLEIEQNLEKPKEYLRKTEIKSIFSNLFKRGKQGQYFSHVEYFMRPLEILNANETLEVLHYTLDTKEDSIFNEKKTSLIQGLVLAYKNHYPITITPDMLWILILQGFSRFMEKYENKVREKFVNFDGKKDLIVERNNLTPYTATKEDWDGIMKEFVEKIGIHVGQETIDNLECNFSTTTQVAQVTSQVSIMSAMKQYFTYTVQMMGCGISTISLEGSIQDWEKIKKKIGIFSQKRTRMVYETSYTYY